MKRKFLKFLILFHIILITSPCYSQEFTMPSFVHAIDACDMDMDGSVDIIASCAYDDSIVILFNDGYGTFEPYYYGRTTGYLLCGCIDGDSIPDIVTTTNNLNFIKNYGDRTLEDNSNILIQNLTFPIKSIFDMNGDGWNDLFYQTNVFSKMGILKNNGDLTLTDIIIFSGITSSPSLGNLNTDTLPDIIVSFPTSETQVYINNGNFNFSSMSILDKVISDPVILESNNNSPEDLALFETPSANVYFYENIGNANFEFRENNPLINAFAIVLADQNDYNNDGYGDICYCQCPITGCNDSIYIAINSQDWSFNEGQAYFVGTLNWFRVISKDLNSDNYPDLIMTGYDSNNKIKILWNSGDGTFTYENPVIIKESDLNTDLILQVNPNPFNYNTQIVIKINQPSLTSLKIIDLFGFEKISFIKSQKLAEGEHSYGWDGNDLLSRQCPPGIYILILEINGNRFSQKLIHY
ncbi:MAG: T9SS type A sorting domain-containing protein [Bacteroidales bacterium]|nr:T9SS type A sorting domain-containing protein [Bacteroidales bacterium]